MKKILILITMLLLTFSALEAGNKQALKHANPMPNLMRIVVGNAVLLDVNDTQMKEVKGWMKTAKPVMKGMIKEVMMKEKALHENALTTDADIEKQADEVLALRKKIIMMKTKCRQELKRILTEKQYAAVVTIYKSVQ
ncbi:MAG: Unknown protein [uncultured Sulfurovum sp.]|uniref:Periplasmic protein n=1 Tax=uncultured Sulfurovum sp. TaxID=269237 RepID=A0A6S6S4U3_9BACT|nr:MAG: Unknown protein [uncultured Sulfurovum sp.]